jgi:predicted secreted hydrolase
MRPRSTGSACAAFLLVGALWLGAAACPRFDRGAQPSSPAGATSTPTDAGAAAVTEVDDSGFESARGSREWSFPRDHGSHPAYATEWWYTTGIVRTAEGRRFGYELTFFRVGLAPSSPLSPAGGTKALAPATAGPEAPAPPTARPEPPVPTDAGPHESILLAPERQVSPWRARDLVLAHATLTDVEGGTFLLDHRESRAAQGWAGADTTRLGVWVDEWRLVQIQASEPPDVLRSVKTDRATSDWRGTGSPAAPGAFILTVPAASTGGRFGLDLRLDTSRPAVLHGRGGLSPKDARAEPHASWYLSLPRLETRGTLTVAGESFRVAGETWMDHEFFTGGLAPKQVGWDWFSARFQDGRDLMLYRLRRRDGTTDFLSGTVVAADGTSWRAVDVRGAALEPIERWHSSSSGVVYPVGWRLRLPAESLDLSVTTPLPGQEVRTGGPTFDYWEGLVDYRGTWEGAETRGEGYLEMTGYGTPLDLR